MDKTDFMFRTFNLWDHMRFWTMCPIDIFEEHLRENNMFFMSNEDMITKNIHPPHGDLDFIIKMAMLASNKYNIEYVVFQIIPTSIEDVRMAMSGGWDDLEVRTLRRIHVKPTWS